MTPTDLRSSPPRFLAVLLAGSLLAAAGTLPASCSAPITALRGQSRPAEAAYRVDATLEQLSRGYYAAVAQVWNPTNRVLELEESQFRLESDLPTQFVPEPRGPWGKEARVPRVVPGGMLARCELFFRIRGTEQPFAPVDLVVVLPDGEYRTRFEIHPQEAF